MTVAPRVYPNVAGPASVLERHRPWIHAHTRGRSSMNTFSGGREGRRRGVKALRRSLEPALSHSTVHAGSGDPGWSGRGHEIVAVSGDPGFGCQARR